MKQRILLDKRGIDGFSGGFCAVGSLGSVHGLDRDMARIAEREDGFCGDFDAFEYLCRVEEQPGGVCIRRDQFRAKTALTVNKLVSRFYLEGGEYEVYTQCSYWKNESNGGWQEMISGVTLSNVGVRTTEGATPMIALRNRANRRITVLHLLPNCAWKISARRFPIRMQEEAILIELGMNCDGLEMNLSTGETVDLPDVIFYETENTLDFDCFRLHEVYNRLYPRKSLPILYNTWMCQFDRIDADSIKGQIDAAAELGIEYFAVDAGWFGDGANWWEWIGSWHENQATGFRGRMKEVSDYIYSRGMKFGLWFEPERALAPTQTVQSHPEYYIHGTGENYFISFSNDAARRFITDTVIGMIRDYRISYLKFDFNAGLSADPERCAFYRYFEGQRRFLADIREAFPDIYITNCASGGYRMEMGQNRVYDSVWISDNQSPVESLRIFCDTALRLPPSNMEKYDTRLFAGIFPYYGHEGKATLPLSCDGASWDSVVTVSEAFTEAFISGGVMGFSADIAGYPADVKAALKKAISDYKQKREFYRNATLRILYRSRDVVVLQYSDSAIQQITLHAFARYSHTPEVTVYPAVSEGVYLDECGNETPSSELAENGISIPVTENDCTVRCFRKR